MRIIAGTAKGRTLRSLRGRALRPTADRVRESVFGMLGERVVEARFLDLYAGVGTVGLEALSRGAAEAVFVESHRPAAAAIRENAIRCGVAPRARVVVAPVLRALGALGRRGERFDLVYVDPPYGSGDAAQAMAAVASGGLLAEGALVLCQHARQEELEEAIGVLRRMRRARYGETIVDLYGAGGGRLEERRSG